MNRINSIASAAFNLTDVYVSHVLVNLEKNHLTSDSFSEDFLIFNTNVQVSLNLAHNKIIELRQEIFEPLLKTNKLVIDLTGNPIKCATWIASNVAYKAQIRGTHCHWFTLKTVQFIKKMTFTICNPSIIFHIKSGSGISPRHYFTLGIQKFWIISVIPRTVRNQQPNWPAAQRRILGLFRNCPRIRLLRGVSSHWQKCPPIELFLRQILAQNFLLRLSNLCLWPLDWMVRVENVNKKHLRNFSHWIVFKVPFKDDGLQITEVSLSRLLAIFTSWKSGSVCLWLTMSSAAQATTSILVMITTVSSSWIRNLSHWDFFHHNNNSSTEVVRFCFTVDFMTIFKVNLCPLQHWAFQSSASLTQPCDCKQIGILSVAIYWQTHCKRKLRIGPLGSRPPFYQVKCLGAITST